MAEEAKKTAPEVEAKNTEEVKPNTNLTVEEKKEATVGEILGQENKEAKLVPESALIQYKKDNKEMKKELEELRQQISEGATKKEVSSTVKDLAKKFNVDEEFLSELAGTMKKEAKSELEEEFGSKIKSFEEKDKAKKIDEVFNQTFDKILEENPEYKGIVNKDVIKALALNPINANKSFSKIIEESYGHLVKGKKTMETTTPRGGNDGEIDFSKARSDTKYFEQIMADPILKKKYNEGLASRLKL